MRELQNRITYRLEQGGQTTSATPSLSLAQIPIKSTPSHMGKRSQQRAATQEQPGQRIDVLSLNSLVKTATTPRVTNEKIYLASSNFYRMLNHEFYLQAGE